MDPNIKEVNQEVQPITESSSINSPTIESTPTVILSAPQKNKSPLVKKIVLGIFLFIIMTLTALASFYFGTKSNKQPSTELTQEIPTPSATPQLSQSLPIGANTISYAFWDGEVYLRFKDKIFQESSSQSSVLQESSMVIPEENWIGVVNAPDNLDPSVIPNQGLGNEIFDFKQFPNNKKQIIFITRWITTERQEFNIYNFDGTKNEELATFSLSESNNTIPNVPRIDKIAQDGRFASFLMFPCWNCGGTTPDYLLLNIDTKATKRIGKASLFSWVSGGGYQYKEYIVKPCPNTEIVMGECYQSPDELPFKNGQF